MPVSPGIRRQPPFQLLYFHTNGCGACEALMPTVTAFAQAQSLPLVLVHAPDRSNGPLISRYEITEIPTVLLLRDGKIAVESPGTHFAKKAILTYLERHSPSHVKTDRRKAVP